MNKKTFFLVAMLALLVGSAKAQWFDFSNNQRASIGVNIGSVGYNLNGKGIDKQYAGFGTGINFLLLACMLISSTKVPNIVGAAGFRRICITTIPRSPLMWAIKCPCFLGCL